MHHDRPLQQRRSWRGWRAPGRALALAAAMVLTAGALPLAAGPAQALATGCPVGAVQSGPNCVMQFSASGTWTVPAGITSVHFFVVGGGGGGGTAYIDAGTSKRFGGGGGGGGGVTLTSQAVTPGDTWTITVGAGGAAGTAGGASSISHGGTTITSTGGGAGANATAGGPGNGGDSGLTLTPASTVTYTGGSALTVGNNGAGGGGAGAGQQAQGNSAKVGGWLVSDVVTDGKLNAKNWASGSYSGIGAGFGGNGYKPETTGTPFDYYYYYSGTYYIQAYGAGGGGGMAVSNSAPVGSGGSSYQTPNALYPNPAGDSGRSATPGAEAYMNGTDGSGGGGGGGASFGATSGDAQSGGIGGSGLVAIGFPKLRAGLSELVGFDTLANYTAWDSSGSYDALDLSPALSDSTDAYELYAPSASTSVWLGLVPLTDNTVSSVTAPGATVTTLASGAKIDGITVGTTVVTVVVDSPGAVVQETYTISILSPPSPPQPGSRALAWGYGGDGALGDGGTTDRTRPVQVAFGANTAGEWSAMGSGYDSSCGVGADGTMYCWGANDYGQFGDGGSTSSTSPVLTSSGANTSGKWSSVSVGSYYACGLSTDAKGYCWGYNGYDTLGDGTGTDQATPVALAAHGTGLSSILAGDHHTCAVKTAGSLHCWGDNSYGEVGDGTTTDRATPTAVSNGANTTGQWKAVSVGYYHTCGLAKNDKAYCWGYNSSGELGDNTTTDRPSPVAVQNGANSAGTWSAITAGYYFTCGISTNHKAYCWGDNGYGQFGDGTDSSSNTPVQVLIPGSQKVVQIQANFYSARVCALTDAPKLYCWGDNGYGEIGDGTTTENFSPVEVQLLGVLSEGTPLKVATGSYTTLLIARFPVLPGAPTISKVTPISGGAKVAFTAGAAGDSPTANYEYQLNGGAWVAFSPAQTTSPLTITGLTNGTTYSVKIRAVSADGAGAASGHKSVTPAALPGAPSITTITSKNKSAVVAFTAGTAGTSPITNYEYQLDGGSWVALSPAVTTSPFTITGLTNGVVYSVKIRAVTADGVSPASAAEAVEPGGFPGAPIVTSITQISGGAQIAFTAGAPGTSPTTNYEYQLDGGAWVAFSPASTSSPLTVSGLANGTTYSIRIRAVSADGPGAPSNAKSVTPGGTPSPTPEPEPTDLKPGTGEILIDGKPVKVTVTVNESRTRVTLTGPNGLVMNLAGQGTDGSPVPVAADGALLLVRDGEAVVSGTGFKPNSLVKLYMLSTPKLIGTTTANGKGTFNGNAAIPKGKQAGDHVIQAVGLTASGKQYHISLAVRVVKKNTAVPPGEVRNLAVERMIATRQAKLTWGAPKATGGAAVTGYLVSYRTVGMSSWMTLASPSKTRYTMSGLVSGCRYDVRVAAVNSAGEGDWTKAVVLMPHVGRSLPFGDLRCRLP